MVIDRQHDDGMEGAAGTDPCRGSLTFQVTGLGGIAAGPEYFPLKYGTKQFLNGTDDFVSWCAERSHHYMYAQFINPGFGEAWANTKGWGYSLGSITAPIVPATESTTVAGRRSSTPSMNLPEHTANSSHGSRK